MSDVGLTQPAINKKGQEVLVMKMEFLGLNDTKSYLGWGIFRRIVCFFNYTG